jgi:hypothetical protein
MVSPSLRLDHSRNGVPGFRVSATVTTTFMEETVAEVREVHEVKSSSGERSAATPWLAFFVGALLVAVVAIFLLNTHARVSGPAGNIDLNIKSPVTTPVTPAR